MTTFQLLAVGFFGLVAVTTYSQQILGALRAAWAKVPAVDVPLPYPDTREPELDLVKDLTTINDLRERLAAAGCTEGADACTILLRVMIEFDYQK